MSEATRADPRDNSGAEPIESQSVPAALETSESLRKRLAIVEKERDEYVALLRRNQADFENYQKRVTRDMEEAKRYSLADFARELLPVLDNLQRALSAATVDRDSSALAQGVAMVQTQLLEAFRRFGISRFEPVGQSFDPSRHEAVSQEWRTDVPPGTVTQVLEPGYLLHDRVLRPSRVVVSSRPTLTQS